jgi:mutator protein MutT
MKTIRVVACVIEREGRFLITRRLKHSHMGHLWEFPGGKIEAGESLEQCAVRECREEIAVEVKPLEVLQEIQHEYPEVRVQLYFMRCELISGEPRAVQCADLAWVLPEELKRYEFPQADQKILARLADSP